MSIKNCLNCKFVQIIQFVWIIKTFPVTGRKVIYLDFCYLREGKGKIKEKRVGWSAQRRVWHLQINNVEKNVCLRVCICGEKDFLLPLSLRVLVVRNTLRRKKNNEKLAWSKEKEIFCCASFPELGRCWWCMYIERRIVYIWH